MSHYFDHAREELEIEFNSRYDYITEAYAGMQETPDQLRAESEYWAEEEAREEAELTAAFGPAVHRIVYVNDDIPF